MGQLSQSSLLELKFDRLFSLKRWVFDLQPITRLSSAHINASLVLANDSLQSKLGGKRKEFFALFFDVINIDQMRNLPDDSLQA